MVQLPIKCTVSSNIDVYVVYGTLGAHKCIMHQ